MRLPCSSVSFCSVCCSSACSSRALLRRRSSAWRRSASTRSKGREKVARPRTLIKALEPPRLSRMLATKSPLCEGLRDALAEDLARLHPQEVHEQIGVGDDDDVGGRGRLGQVGHRRAGGRLLIRRRSLGVGGIQGSGDSRRQCIADPGGLEAVTQGGRVGECVEALRRNRRGAGGAQQQRLEVRLGAGARGEKAGGSPH